MSDWKCLILVQYSSQTPNITIFRRTISRFTISSLLWFMLLRPDWMCCAASNPSCLGAHQPLAVLGLWSSCFISNNAICACSLLFPSNCLGALQPGSLIFQHYLIVHLGLSGHRVFKKKEKKRKCSRGLPLPPAVCGVWVQTTCARVCGVANTYKM